MTYYLIDVAGSGNSGDNTGGSSTPGPQGPPGQDGLSVNSGSGAPSNSVGKDGDTYLDTSGGVLYAARTAGAYPTTGLTLKGVKGDTGAASTVPGPKGDTGSAGPAGPASTVPGPQGPKGDTGNTGATGPTGPAGADSTVPGPQGPKGDTGAASTVPGPKGDTGAASTVPGPKGDTGAAGTAGTNGNTILSGTGQGAPANTVGNPNDFFLNTSTYVLYGPKGSTSWPTPGTSIIGPMGTPGTNGTAGTNGTNGTNGVDGRTILNGSGAPASTVGNNGDFYIDTTAYKIYGPKASGAWPSTGTSLIGPAGSGGSSGGDLTGTSLTLSTTSGPIIESFVLSSTQQGQLNFRNGGTNVYQMLADVSAAGSGISVKQVAAGYNVWSWSEPTATLALGYASSTVNIPGTLKVSGYQPNYINISGSNYTTSMAQAGSTCVIYSGASGGTMILPSNNDNKYTGSTFTLLCMGGSAQVTSQNGDVMYWAGPTSGTGAPSSKASGTNFLNNNTPSGSVFIVAAAGQAKWAITQMTGPGWG